MKKIIITALLLASVLSLSACSKAPDELPSELVSVNYEDNETSSNLQSSVSSESITSSQESDTHEKDLFSNITVTTKPIIVCQWTDAEKRLFANKFKEKYGIPENIPTGYEELSKSSEPIIWTFMDNDTISVKALSDSAPDLCIIDGNYGLFMNNRIKKAVDAKYDTMFKKIDELIDFSKSEWDDFRPFINYQKENGGIYLAPTETYLNGLCYIKSDITDNNLENPYELYSNSEWTWDKFYDVCEKYAEKNDSAIGFYTAYTAGRIYPFLSLTDVNFVDYKNKKFISNINHPDVIKTLEFIFKLGHADKVTERSNEELSKTALFYNLSDVVRLYKRSDSDYKNIGFVPYPKQNKESVYNLSASFEAFAIPNGTKNMNGAMAFIDIFLSPDTKAYINQYTKQTDVDNFVLQANKNAGEILLNNPVKFDYSAVFDELCGSSEAGYPISTMIYRCICENETDFNDIFANGKNAIKEMCGYYNN